MNKTREIPTFPTFPHLGKVHPSPSPYLLNPPPAHHPHQPSPQPPSPLTSPPHPSSSPTGSQSLSLANPYHPSCPKPFSKVPLANTPSVSPSPPYPLLLRQRPAAAHQPQSSRAQQGFLALGYLRERMMMMMWENVVVVVLMGEEEEKVGGGRRMMDRRGQGSVGM